MPPLVATWGLLGFTALLGWAVIRLAPMTGEALSMGLSPLQWIALVANVLFMAYSEGYRGFQKSYSPKLADRLERLSRERGWLECLLAPLYAMGFFRASTRQLITTYLLTALIICAVVLFRYIPQPWRGVLDAGVVVGLIWGIVATWAIVLGRQHRRSVTEP